MHHATTICTPADSLANARARRQNMERRFREGSADFPDLVAATVAENKIRVRMGFPTVTTSGAFH